MPTYLRGKTRRGRSGDRAAAVDNEEEGYGRNAGSKRHYYRIARADDRDLAGLCRVPRDGLRIEVFETWLERI